MGSLITPEDFVKKWSQHDKVEKKHSHLHFIDLCNLLHEPTPNNDEEYCFEKELKKTTNRFGWADVYKKGCFALEYKSRHEDLGDAFVQLQQYSPALENPPLLIVSDMADIIIHTNWTNTVSETIEINPTDILDYNIRKKLQLVFEDPEKLKPNKTRAEITEEIASEFAGLAEKIRSRGYDGERVAHFLNKLVFCMFAEDIGLLPDYIFTSVIKAWLDRPNDEDKLLKQLFKSMRKGEYFGVKKIDWFNGGLFEEADDVIPLSKDEIHNVLKAAEKEWSDIDPVIFGTLFERGLDPQTRAKLGAHYTDAGSIYKIIKPVIIEPLTNEWNEVKDKLSSILNKQKDKYSESIPKEAKTIYQSFLSKVQSFKILDPACGSGNFLNLALQELKDFEHKVILEAVDLGLKKEFPQVDPKNVMGIDINPYATELAKVSIWIGDLQWMVKHGYWISKNPILKSLNNIETRDALLNDNGNKSFWPESDVIVGNPPFLGGYKMKSYFGDDYVIKLRAAYNGSIPGMADLVVYWFNNAAQQLLNHKVDRVGLVSTNSIRTGINHIAMSKILKGLNVYNAWSDLPWVLDGAQVRVSIINFTNINDKNFSHKILDGKEARLISLDLKNSTSHVDNLTASYKLLENKNTCFSGMKKSGPFEIHGELARSWLSAINPNRKSNSIIIKPWSNGYDITHRSHDFWIIDFGVDMPESEASLYELPLQYVFNKIKPIRDKSSFELERNNWWILSRPRPKLREAVHKLTRYIVTSKVAKYRIFSWLDKNIIPDISLVVIARDDDTTFGILNSIFHKLWTLKFCSWMGVGNDPCYTSSTIFETFPFPEGLTPNISTSKYANDPRAKAIAEAAKELNELRDSWLNPHELIKVVPEVVKGYPDRILPKDEASEKELKKRTLTNLYNSKPQWLINAHKKLDDAVAKAYGWETDLSDDEILKRLLELNLERTKSN